MVNWYNPRQLSATAMKAVISGIFAGYADKREMQAALDPEKKGYTPEFDSEQGVWFDFISDTGDGFNSTYTVADLSAQQLSLHYELNGTPTSVTLPAAQMLILGGDQVYPTPSMEEYEDRFRIPFRAASTKHHKDGLKRMMYAIPGNHDWYDGLGNFIKLFCQQRQVGQWQTCQHRSYFAIKLPSNYWLWAIDVQLASDIDQPQKDYFEDIVVKDMQDGDQIILCTSEPAWVYQCIYRDDTSYEKLKFFLEYFVNKSKYCFPGKKEVSLAACITGDLHHYSRYEESAAGEIATGKIQMITAGGGGAFLHPTHNLPLYNEKEGDESLNSSEAVRLELKSCYPSKKESRLLLLRVLLFPFYNPAFVLTMITIQALLGYLLICSGRATGESFSCKLAAVTTLPDYMLLFVRHLLLNPPVLIINIAIIAGLTAFTDRRSGKFNYWLLGTLHGVLQLACLFWCLWLYSFLYVFHPFDDKLASQIFYSVAALLTGGLAGSFLMGFYLWFTNRVLDIHINESFSALGHSHFKNFLRMHITPQGDLEIYPIGIRKVVTRWQQHGADEKMQFNSKNKADYHLIEPPIIIKKKV
jgi:3',5'-cyclic AMP phosphodiesterase CpdA